ncbi:AP2/ERF domain-containing protein [Artemisia annua]|uniref:AP2/ERF domain-containing protein n=1 Tax=Artemisia annua TaxID=35608 RepID=A0A2U1NZM8_ARTAN|nr:AP2/ERF domain-containing protein [Artemisia annua]
MGEIGEGFQRAQLNLQQPSASGADNCCNTTATSTSSSSPRGSGSSSSSSTTTLRPILPRPAAFNLTFAPTQSTTSNVPVLANYVPYQFYNNPSIQQHGTNSTVGNLVQYSSQLAQPRQYLPYPNINNKISGMETEGPTLRMTTTPRTCDTTSNVNPSINVCQREHLQPKNEDMNSLVGSVGYNLSLVSNSPPWDMVVGDSVSDPTVVAGVEPSSPSLWSLTNDDEYPPPSIWDYGDPSFDF